MNKILRFFIINKTKVIPFDSEPERRGDLNFRSINSVVPVSKNRITPKVVLV
jgi:hypothetical protein